MMTPPKGPDWYVLVSPVKDFVGSTYELNISWGPLKTGDNPPQNLVPCDFNWAEKASSPYTGMGGFPPIATYADIPSNVPVADEWKYNTGCKVKNLCKPFHCSIWDNPGAHAHNLLGEYLGDAVNRLRRSYIFDVCIRWTLKSICPVQPDGSCKPLIKEALFSVEYSYPFLDGDNNPNVRMVDYGYTDGKTCKARPNPWNPR